MWYGNLPKSLPLEIGRRYRAYTYTHKSIEWSWAKDQVIAFEKIKVLLTKAPLLAYYNPKLLLCIQCDSSQFGHGVALLQGGKPLDFKSRTLTPTQQR